MIRFTINVAVATDFLKKEINSQKRSRHGKDAAMPGPNPSPCTFPDDFVQVALATVRRRTEAGQVVQRSRLEKEQANHDAICETDH